MEFYTYTNFNTGERRPRRQTSPTMSKIGSQPLIKSRVLIIQKQDMDLYDKAHLPHFRLVQMVGKGNFSARLPLEKKMTKMIYDSKVVVMESSRGYSVIKDYGGNFLKSVPYSKIIESFGSENIVRFKLTRKAKKECKKYEKRS